MLETHPESAVAELCSVCSSAVTEPMEQIRTHLLLDVRQLQLIYARACTLRYSSSFSPIYVYMLSLKGKEDWCSGLQYHCCLVAMTLVTMSRKTIMSLFFFFYLKDK